MCSHVTLNAVPPDDRPDGFALTTFAVFTMVSLVAVSPMAVRTLPSAAAPEKLIVPKSANGAIVQGDPVHGASVINSADDSLGNVLVVWVVAKVQDGEVAWMVNVKALPEADTWAWMTWPGATGNLDVDRRTAARGYIWYHA